MDKITHFEENHGGGGGGGEMHESRSTALTLTEPPLLRSIYVSCALLAGRRYRAKFNFGK